jgi:nucleoid-associated protein YgaU
MTRENKLALVVGFGLILFVGILISDHFSAARRQMPANLATSAQLMDNQVSDTTLVDLMASNQGALPVELETLPQQADATQTTTPDAAQAPLPERIDMGATAQVNPPVEVPPGFKVVDDDSFNQQTPPPAVQNFEFHSVAKGETLNSICRAYYGDTSMVGELAKANGLSDPNALREGHRLRMPSKPGSTEASARSSSGSAPANAPQIKTIRTQDVTTPHAAAPPQAQPQNQQQAALRKLNFTTHTVAKGETLAKLSRKYLGSAGKWKQIYELNKSVIDDPDNVRPGTTLRIPNKG